MRLLIESPGTQLVWQEMGLLRVSLLMCTRREAGRRSVEHSVV